MLPAVTEMTGMQHHAQLVSTEMENFFAQVGLEP
jgi:hypothetical protein